MRFGFIFTVVLASAFAERLDSYPNYVWVDDGRGGTSSRENTVECIGTLKGSQRYHSQLQCPIGANENVYVEATVLEGGAGLGLTTKESLKPGWGTRGFFYNSVGNLSDGGAALRSSFGPALGPGDRVGFQVVTDDEGLRVYVYVNSVDLGLAFELNRGDPLFPEILYPTLAFSNAGASASLEIGGTVPYPAAPDDYMTLVGKWQMPGIRMTIEEGKEELEYQASATIANVMNFSFKFKKEGSAEIFPIGPVASTLMMGSPEQTQLERKFLDFLDEVQTVSLQETGALEFRAPEKYITLQRVAHGGEAVTSNPLARVGYVS